MATINYLISVDDLKKLGIIHQNVDTKLLARCIKVAQDMDIQTITGTPLFNALLDRVENNNWNTAYNELMQDYVIPCLVGWVDYHACDYLNVKATNKNVGRAQDDQRTANTDAQNTDFKQKLYKIAQFYSNRLIGFLKDNDDIYPEYIEVSNNFEDVKKQRKEGGLSNTLI